jgi:hypothetical protein
LTVGRSLQFTVYRLEKVHSQQFSVHSSEEEEEEVNSSQFSVGRSFQFTVNSSQ